MIIYQVWACREEEQPAVGFTSYDAAIEHGKNYCPSGFDITELNTDLETEED